MGYEGRPSVSTSRILKRICVWQEINSQLWLRSNAQCFTGTLLCGNEGALGEVGRRCAQGVRNASGRKSETAEDCGDFNGGRHGVLVKSRGGGVRVLRIVRSVES